MDELFPRVPGSRAPAGEFVRLLSAYSRADARACYWVALLGDEVVGVLDCDGREGTSAELTVLVHQAHRRRGLASSLLEEAIAWASGRAELRELRAQVLKDNIPAIALYSKHGFASRGPDRLLVRRRGREIHDRVMTRKLSRSRSD
jgi:putative acetyltransferase